MKNIVKSIVFDTNFLLDVVRFKINLEDIDKLVVEPYRLATLDSVVAEIKKIAASKKVTSKYAKVALKLIERGYFKIIRTKMRTGKVLTDDLIVNIVRKDKSGRKNTIVATNDAKLRKRIKALGVKTIYLRARKHLEIK